MVRLPIPQRMWLLTLLSALTLVWSATVTPAGAVQNAEGPVTIDLDEVQDSGVAGTATFTAQDGQTTVDMTLQGPGVEGGHPTHIHTGTCSDFDPDPLIPLETVVLEFVNQTGRSTTTIDASLESLQSGDYVVLVHLSPEALTTYLVCGEIPQAQGAVVDELADTPTVAAAGTGGHATHNVSTPAANITMMPPDVGAGSSLQQADGSGFARGLAVAAGFLFIVAAAIRRYKRI